MAGESYNHLTSENLAREGAAPFPSTARSEVAAQYAARGMGFAPDPNLQQLLGEGETTFFLNAVPSNEVTLAGVIGAQVQMTFTNNGKWPLLLKALGLTAASHLDWVWQLQRSDGNFPIGSGWHHARNLSGVGVPLLLGNGIALGRQNSYTITFQNLSAVSTTILFVARALEVANPEGIPVGASLEDQARLLNTLAQKWRNLNGLAPEEVGLALQLIRNGRFYTFPITNPTVASALSARFASVDLSTIAVGAPLLASWRNETGGTFIWEGIVYHSTGAAVPGDSFTWAIEVGGGSWKMTQGSVQSRAFQGGRNAIGQWVPIHLPKPWIVPSGATMQVTLTGQGGAQPGVWFEAVGTLVGGLGVN